MPGFPYRHRLMVDTLLGQLKTKVHQGHRPCAHKAQHREGLEEESVDTEELAKLGTARRQEDPAMASGRGLLLEDRGNKHRLRWWRGAWATQ